MTEQEAIDAQELDPQPSPKYFIDESWFETHRFSLQQMMEARSGNVQPAESPSKRRKKVGATSMADLAKIEGFVSHELPILEAVFRLLLSHENKPMEIERISEELAERGIGIKDARVVNPETLVRLLDNDGFYGLARYPES